MNPTPIRQGTLCDVEPVNRGAIKLEPELIDDFKLTRAREVIIGRSNHKYLVEKYLYETEPLNFDLYAGFETYDPKPSDEGLDYVLTYILKKAESGQSLKEVIRYADFVCFRGNVTKIAASPFEEGGIGWKFAVTKFNNVFFLMELDTPARIAERAKENLQSKMGTYSGHKFETYIFAKDGEEPDTMTPVNTWEEMRAMFRTDFPANGFEPTVKLFYTAEMDGIDPQTGKHLEAKTQFKELFCGRYFNQKAMKWYLQSALVGIETLVVGYKPNAGTVDRLEKVELEWLRQKCNTWNSNVCFRAAQHVFNEIRYRYDQEILPGEMLVVERKPNQLKVQYQVVPEGSYEILTPEFKARFGGAKN